jgi:hypothetical protein
MAVYNEVMVGRYVRFLQKFLGIKGRQPAPLTFSGELSAMWPLFHGVENRYLESWDRYAFAFALAAGGAGNFNQFRIRNPAASNAITVFERIAFCSSVADSPLLTHGAAAADLTSAVTITNARWDSRGRPTSAMIASDNSVTPQTNLASTAYAANTAANVPIEFIWYENQEIPLLPGDAIQITSNVGNQGNQAMFWWRERALEEGELK